MYHLLLSARAKQTKAIQMRIRAYRHKISLFQGSQEHQETMAKDYCKSVPDDKPAPQFIKNPTSS